MVSFGAVAAKERETYGWSSPWYLLDEAMEVAAAAGGGMWSVMLEARRRREELERSRLDGLTFDKSVKMRARAVYRSWSRSWDRCWVGGGEESRARGVLVLAC